MQIQSFIIIIQLERKIQSKAAKYCYENKLLGNQIQVVL